METIEQTRSRLVASLNRGAIICICCSCSSLIIKKYKRRIYVCSSFERVLLAFASDVRERAFIVSYDQMIMQLARNFVPTHFYISRECRYRASFLPPNPGHGWTFKEVDFLLCCGWALTCVMSFIPLKWLEKKGLTFILT